MYLHMYHDSEGKLYFTTSPAAAERFFSQRAGSYTAVWEGTCYMKKAALHRVGRGIYRRVKH